MKHFYFILLVSFQAFSQWSSGDFYCSGFDTNAQLGTSSAISGNGNVIAFGAISNYANYLGMSQNAGYVDVFHNVSGIWVQKGSRIKGSFLEKIRYIN